MFIVRCPDIAEVPGIVGVFGLNGGRGRCHRSLIGFGCCPRTGLDFAKLLPILIPPILGFGRLRWLLVFRPMVVRQVEAQLVVGSIRKIGGDVVHFESLHRPTL